MGIIKAKGAYWIKDSRGFFFLFQIPYYNIYKISMKFKFIGLVISYVLSNFRLLESIDSVKLFSKNKIFYFTVLKRKSNYLK